MKKLVKKLNKYINKGKVINMGMHDNLFEVFNVLKNDEKLLRLLYYPPQDLAKNIPDPLDERLKNIGEMESEKQALIRGEHIYFSPQADDLETKKICRLYLYAGKRRPTSNYLMADQEIVIDILCPFEYENGDMRSMKIADRINELVCLNRITGIGKVDYVYGNQVNALKDYVAYQHIFKVCSMKK
ncbi:hypothetical protein [Heyndrickxia oleronia]|uniref:hypothetical protein n=1 Tax=Heyndrickxia oleronia TaxID=38875 RepID=UPI00242BE69B|nr:hypothetical protein [Heyndrickxia oleronia]MCI1590397.1 hypothetical protein [Heyndrickxia oleronia]MCI1611341.1 hypothetical protein [Heyndrickxia oleronia]MCI1763131.1 hypothetical protein [Heyndrickxia oleronia]